MCKKCTILFWLFLLSVSCIETTKEIDSKDFYNGDQLAVIGYLSNKGAVVNLQHTVSPLNKDKKPYLVKDASVILKKKGDSDLIINFISHNNIDFYTPDTFVPEPDESYYIEITATGYEPINSSAQKINEIVNIDSIKGNYRKANTWKDDSTYFELFGYPRIINLECWFDTKKHTSTFSQFRILYWSDLEKFDSNGKIIHFPDFYVELGIGTLTLTPKKRNTFFSDHIITNEKIVYKDKEWNLVKVCNRFTIQLFSYSNDFREFMTNVNAYVENSMSPFSIVAKPIPSNMSNNVGFWGYVYINEVHIVLPPEDKGCFY